MKNFENWIDDVIHGQYPDVEIEYIDDWILLERCLHKTNAWKQFIALSENADHRGKGNSVK